MRGKKSYNIRNIEAHLNRPLVSSQEVMNETTTNSTPLFYLGNRMNYQYYGNNANTTDNNIANEIQHVRAQYGVSKYTANMVSGKMFKSSFKNLS